MNPNVLIYMDATVFIPMGVRNEPLIKNRKAGLKLPLKPKETQKLEARMSLML